MLTAMSDAKPEKDAKHGVPPSALNKKKINKLHVVYFTLVCIFFTGSQITVVQSADSLPSSLPLNFSFPYMDKVLKVLLQDYL